VFLSFLEMALDGVSGLSVLRSFRLVCIPIFMIFRFILITFRSK
jgi:hypothetical protein